MYLIVEFFLVISLIFDLPFVISIKYVVRMICPGILDSVAEYSVGSNYHARSAKNFWGLFELKPISGKFVLPRLFRRTCLGTNAVQTKLSQHACRSGEPVTIAP
jgi:hypothetical protein